MKKRKKKYAMTMILMKKKLAEETPEKNSIFASFKAFLILKDHT